MKARWKKKKAKCPDEKDDSPPLYIHIFIYYKSFNNCYTNIRSYMYICVCVSIHMIKVIETTRLLEDNTISDLFCPRFCRLENNSFFIWQASNYQLDRVVSVLKRLGGFFVKEASVNWSSGNIYISK